MNPSQTVGTRRDPLGFSAWRNIAHRIFLRVESPFIRHWFKNRLPPSPTPQVDFHLWMLGNLEQIRKWKMQNRWPKVCYWNAKGLPRTAEQLLPMSFWVAQRFSAAIKASSKKRLQPLRFRYPARRSSSSTSSSALASLLARCCASAAGTATRRFNK
jgi:hypothetical protein